MAPVVAGTVGVIGTVAGIAERNSQVRRQQQAIDAQISAQKRAELIRTNQIEFQRKIADQQFQLESMQNQFDSAIQQGNLQIQELQNQSAYSTQASAASSAGIQNQIARLMKEYEAISKKFQLDQQASQTEVQSMNEAASGLTQVANQNAQIEAALKQGNIELATAIAQSIANQEQNKAPGSTGYAQQSRSDKARKEGLASRMEFEAAMQMLQSGQVSEELIQSVVRSSEFADMLREMGLIQSQMDMQMNNMNTDLAATGIQNNLNSSYYQYLMQDRGIKGAQQLLPLQAQTRQSQLYSNRLAQEMGLDSEKSLIKANTYAQIAQLEANRPRKVGFLSALAQVGGAAMPFISLLGPKTGTTPVGNTGVSQPIQTTLNFDSPNRFSNWVA